MLASARCQASIDRRYLAGVNGEAGLAERLAELLDYNRAKERTQERPEKRPCCAAPLVASRRHDRDPQGGGASSRKVETLSMRSSSTIFRSQAAVAIQNLTRPESLQARILTAERKHAIADLARTVSHDVNNALGSMLPLVQQMQADLQAGKQGQCGLSGRSRSGAEIDAGLPTEFSAVCSIRTGWCPRSRITGRCFRPSKRPWRCSGTGCNDEASSSS